MSELSDEEIRESLKRQPILWAMLRQAAAMALAVDAVDATPERVDTLAVAIWRRQLGDELAQAQEFIPAEERSRIYAEETARLSELHPEGFTEEVWREAVIRRFKEEYPEAFGP
jgi:hypothetical protein